MIFTAVLIVLVVLGGCTGYDPSINPPVPEFNSRLTDTIRTIKAPAEVESLLTTISDEGLADVYLIHQDAGHPFMWITHVAETKWEGEERADKLVLLITNEGRMTYYVGAGLPLVLNSYVGSIWCHNKSFDVRPFLLELERVLRGLKTGELG